MKALIQRVRRARVVVDRETVGEIGPGLCVLLGIASDDTPEGAAGLARRVAALRIFENEAGKLDRSLVDMGGAALVVSQFTLVADTRKGNRPSFSGAARPELATALYELFCDELRRTETTVATGTFGARMLVEIENEGPVTIMLET